MSQEIDTLLARVAGTPEPTGMVNHVNAHVRVTSGELKAAVDANPTHPVALAYRNAAYNFPADRKHVVETVSLEALLKNYNIDVKESVVDGERVRTKVLGGSRISPATPTTPIVLPPPDSHGS